FNGEPPSSDVSAENREHAKGRHDRPVENPRLVVRYRLQWRRSLVHEIYGGRFKKDIDQTPLEPTDGGCVERVPALALHKKAPGCAIGPACGIGRVNGTTWKCEWPGSASRSRSQFPA